MKYILPILSLTLLAAACSTSPTVTPSRENLMRSKKWKISGGTMTVKKPDGKDTALKYVDFLPECYKDDYLSFDSLHFGLYNAGGVTCNPADPATRQFTWRLWNNDEYIDLFDGFNNVFAVTNTIEPYRFETLSEAPLVLDTLVGRLDTTPGFLKDFIVLDTIRELRFTAYQIPDFTIYGAEIKEFSENSFKLNFSFKTRRLDSTNFHAGAPNNHPPIDLPDTTHYSLIYSAF